MEILLLIITAIMLIGIKWMVTMGIVWAVCQCFGFSFSMAIATIGWLVLLIVAAFLKIIGDE